MGKKESKRLQTNAGNLKTIHYAPKRIRAPTFNAVISCHRLYSTANDPQPKMIPRPQMIPKMDRK